MRRVGGKRAKKNGNSSAESLESEENGNVVETQEETASVEVAETETPSKKKNNKRGGGKKGTKAKAAAQKKPADSDAEEDFEVESIVGMRFMHGKRQFKIRWMGYPPEDDTWSYEHELHCSDLIREFLESQKDELGESSGENKKGKKRKSAANNTSADDDDDDDDGEFEVEKVLDVKFKKNGKREFLIRWKNYAPRFDSWEPEENLSCEDLISKLLEKVEKAKETSDHELRTKPKQTKRLTLSNPQIRTSRRFKNEKERKTYHDDLE